MGIMSSDFKPDLIVQLSKLWDKFGGRSRELIIHRIEITISGQRPR